MTGGGVRAVVRRLRGKASIELKSPGEIEAMRAAGCRVELEVWPRMPHVWHLYVRVLPQARRAIERISGFVRAEILPDRPHACLAPSSA